MLVAIIIVAVAFVSSIALLLHLNLKVNAGIRKLEKRTHILTVKHAKAKTKSQNSKSKLKSINRKLLILSLNVTLRNLILLRDTMLSHRALIEPKLKASCYLDYDSNTSSYDWSEETRVAVLTKDSTTLVAACAAGWFYLLCEWAGFPPCSKSYARDISASHDEEQAQSCYGVHDFADVVEYNFPFLHDDDITFLFCGWDTFDEGLARLEYYIKFQVVPPNDDWMELSDEDNALRLTTAPL